MFDEMSIIRCIAKGLNKISFTEGNLYRIISKDFEHAEGHIYGIVDDAGLIHYFNEEDVQKYFTDKDVPNEITYFFQMLVLLLVLPLILVIM
jgi:preprotein translocase subunit Sec61beta